MDFDFNLILVPVTLVLGVVWLLDKLVLKQKKQRGLQQSSFVVRWAYDFFPILAVVLALRSFLIEPFNIPSSSMVPTLYTGDFIAVNKYTYGIRLPLLNKKIIPVNDPTHGDVIVFRYPLNPKIYYIKRVIGVGGDTVSFNNGVLSVNGKAVVTENTTFNADPTLTEQLYPADKLSIEQAKQQGVEEESRASYTKEMSNGKEHLVRHLGENLWYQYASFLQQTSPDIIPTQGQSWQVTVPQGQYFVMGDNRERSADSRFWGFVPDENVAGKAVYIWMHKEAGLNMPTFNRNGTIH